MCKNFYLYELHPFQSNPVWNQYSAQNVSIFQLQWLVHIASMFSDYINTTPSDYMNTTPSDYMNNTPSDYEYYSHWTV